MDMLTPTFVRELCANLGHIGYYRKFIQSYAKVVALLETIAQRYEICLDPRMSGGIGHIEREIGDYTDLVISILNQYITCACGCVLYCT